MEALKDPDADVKQHAISALGELGDARAASAIAGAFLLTRLMTKLLFNVKPGDPLTFAAVSLILAGVAALASYLPGLRATQVDPVVALRAE